MASGLTPPPLELPLATSSPPQVSISSSLQAIHGSAQRGVRGSQLRKQGKVDVTVVLCLFHHSPGERKKKVEIELS